MQSAGTNHFYEHPYNYVKDVDKCINYGWYQHFRTVLNTQTFKDHLVNLEVPRALQVYGSPQRTYLDNDSVELVKAAVKTKMAFARSSKFVLKIEYGLGGIFTRFICLAFSALIVSVLLPISTPVNISALVIQLLKYMNQYVSKVESVNRFIVQSTGMNLEYSNKEPWLYVGDTLENVSNYHETVALTVDKHMMLIGGCKQSYDEFQNSQLSKMEIPSAIEQTFIQEGKMLTKVLKKERQRAAKDLIKSQPDVVKASDYYMVKKLDYIEYNEDVIAPIHSEYVEKVAGCISAQYSYVPPCVENGLCKVTKSGFDVDKNGKKEVEFEFSSRDPLNAIYGVFGRQLACKTKITITHKRAFNKCTDRWMDFMFKKFKIFKSEVIDFYSWIDNKKEF